MGKRKRTRVIPGERGDPCPRCGRSTEVREHVEITPKHLLQPWYYSRWFYCTNPKCKTTMIMPDLYRVFRDRQAACSGALQDDDIVMAVLSESDTPPWDD
jgi:hypothetical protein